MLKINFMIGKSIRPLAFSLVTASSLIALVGPSYSMDAPLSRIEILKQHRAAKQTFEAATKDVNLAEVEFKTAGERVVQEQTLENLQLFGAAEKKKSAGLKLLEVAKENLAKLEKLKAESDAAMKTQRPVLLGITKEDVAEVQTGSHDELHIFKKELVERYFNDMQVDIPRYLKIVEKHLNMICACSQSADINKARKHLEEAKKLLSVLQAYQPTIQQHINQLKIVKQELVWKAENDYDRVKIKLEQLKANLGKQESILVPESVNRFSTKPGSEAEETKTGAAALPPPPVVKPAMPQPVNRTFTRPVDEAAKAAAEKAAKEQAAEDARVTAAAAAQLAAHQKWMDEQAEQRKQAAAAANTAQPTRALPTAPGQAQARAPQIPVQLETEDAGAPESDLLKAIKAKRAVLNATSQEKEKVNNTPVFLLPVPLPVLPQIDLSDWDTDADFEADNTDKGRKAVIVRVEMSAKERDDIRQALVTGLEAAPIPETMEQKIANNAMPSTFDFKAARKIQGAETRDVTVSANPLVPNAPRPAGVGSDSEDDSWVDEN